MSSSLIQKLRNHITHSNIPTTYLHKPHVLEWLFAEPSFIHSLSKEQELEWGRSTIGNITNQWTTKLGEYILQDILLLHNKTPTRISSPKKASNGKKLMPDWETEDALYENKARTYTVSGTAGEKILGTPLKYCECSSLYNKPLYIVCMAYQEVEADLDFSLFNPKSEEVSALLSFFQTNYQICFVKATDLLKSILD
jgi:hypothetical protein